MFTFTTLIIINCKQKCKLLPKLCSDKPLISSLLNAFSPSTLVAPLLKQPFTFQERTHRCKMLLFKKFYRKTPYQVSAHASVISLVELQNGDRIYLKSFPSHKIHEFFEYVKKHKLVDTQTARIHATGGGAYKYQ